MTVVEIFLLIVVVAAVPVLVSYVRHDAFRAGPPPHRDELGRPLTYPRH